ncbi:hypothetical protein [Kineococcus gypseus]|uniref:hypothetical protein n=1 Tax=Kineococcus gypseus TaxID=1637102 RepID=UPI003D7DA2BC
MSWASAAVLLAVLARSLLTSAAAVREAVRAARGPFQVVEGWQLSQYWLGHGAGFVRRGLPGEVLARAVGGAPDLAQAQRAALGLTLAGAAGALVLTAALVLAARGAWRRAALAAVVLSSPLTLPLLAHDLGRYDALGWVVLPVLALLPWRGRRAWPTALLSAALVAAATATEEFLVAAAVPVVLLGVREALPGRRARAAAAGLVALGPGLALALASALVPAPPAAVAAALERGAAAGAVLGDPNAVTTLAGTWRAQLRWVRDLQPEGVVLAVLVTGGLAAAAGALAWWALGRPAPRAAAAAGAWASALALALHAVGVDHRRWWSLALLTFLACLLRLVRAQRARAQRGGRAGRVPRPAPVPVPVQLAAVAVALLGLPAHDSPVYPRWDPSVPGTSAPLDAAQGLSLREAALRDLLGWRPPGG